MTPEEIAEMQRKIRFAIADPGAFLPREENESVPQWSMRAVFATIEAHPVLEIRPYYPTQDAYDATCKALEKHRQRADNAEAEVERLTAVLTEVDQDAKEARMERDEAKAQVEPLDRWADIHEAISKHRDSAMTDNELTDAICALIPGGDDW